MKRTGSTRSISPNSRTDRRFHPSRSQVAGTITLLIAIGTMPGMWWGVRYATYGRLAAHLGGERAAARRANLPLTPQELRATFPKVAVTDNAAPLYLKATKNLPREPRGLHLGHFRLSHTTGKRGYASPEIRAFFYKNAAALADAERASRMPGCDWYIPHAPSDAIYPNRSVTPEGLIGYFCERALLRSDAGDIAGALADISTASRIAYHLGRRPDVLGPSSQSWAVCQIDIAFRDIVLLHRDDSQIIALAQGAEQALARSTKLDLAPSVRSEALNYFVTLDQFRRNPASFYPAARTTADDEHTDEEYNKVRPQLPTGPPLMLADAWETIGIRYWLAIARAADHYPNDPLRRYRAIQTVEFDQPPQRPGYEFMTSDQYSSDVRITPIVQNGVTLEVRDRLRRTLLALLEARQNSPGKVWPAQLPPASASPPLERIDPYNNQPLRYKVTDGGRGFVLYSIGENGKDEGGSMNKPITGDANNNRTDDIAIRFP